MMCSSSKGGDGSVIAAAVNCWAEKKREDVM
jgi:hypothetical protein